MVVATAAAGRAVAFDSERAAAFLEKADAVLPDACLAGLRDAADIDLGVDERLLRESAAAFALAVPPRRARVQGTFHRLFDAPSVSGEAGLLRIAALGGERWASLMELEARLAAMLRAAGLPIPACESRELGAGSGTRGVQLVSRVPGNSLAELDADEARMLEALGWVGRFLAELHRLGGTGAGPLSLSALQAHPPSLAGVHASWDQYVLLRLEEHVVDCERAGDLAPGESARVRACFAQARGELAGITGALLHGDPGNHNFIVGDEGIRGVIDWEDALLGDPLFDLASLCTFHPERRHEAIFAAYGAQVRPGTLAFERFWLYFLRIALAKTVHRRRFGYTDRPGRAPAARRIQLALARLEGAPA